MASAIPVVALWLIYAAAAAAALWIAHRFVRSFPVRAGVVLALAPLVFTGKAMHLGRIYGPADLYYAHDPWKHVASEQGVTGIANPILSDLAFANLPWRSAVREAIVNGRFPLWNRFVLAGNPLLGAAQAGIFHPSTWLAILLPVALSWTFSCTFTIFLALLSGFLFFRDFHLRPLPAVVGAVGWGFSTYVLFWDGWSVGPSIAVFPLLLLGLRRLVSGEGQVIGLTVVALLLSFAGGHPETFFHCVAAGFVYFLWELLGRGGRAQGPPLRHVEHDQGPEATVERLPHAARASSSIPRALLSALLAAALAFLLAGPQLFPLVEAIRHSSEYRARQTAASEHSSQSVSAREAAARFLPAILPFAHGIFGRSPVQAERQDGSGMPIGYAGALLFPLAAYGLSRNRRLERERPERGRSLFVGFVAAGWLFGSSAPGLIDLVSRFPGFSLALNYRLVFLASLGLAGLAAFGTERVCEEDSWRGLAPAAAGVLVLLAAVFLLTQGVLRERALSGSFVRASFAWEVVPVGLLGAAALVFPRRRRVVLLSTLALLIVQRFGEMSGVYPTLAARMLAPPLPSLAKLSESPPWRVVAAGDVFRPNGAALYGLEDARGYESLVLDRFAETYPLWSKPQHASFNRVDNLSSPFLSFLNIRFAIAPPKASVPFGWQERVRGNEMAVFENPRSLPRAFAPRRIRFEHDPRNELSDMAIASDFGEIAWVRSNEAGERPNGPAEVAVRSVGPDLLVSVAAAAPRVFVATSLPDWPGWSGESKGGHVPLATVNHAFVGFWANPGRGTVRLRYRPASFAYGLAAFALGFLVSGALVLRSRRSSG